MEDKSLRAKLKPTVTNRMTCPSWRFLRTFSAEAAKDNEDSWDFLRTFNARQISFAGNWQAVELMRNQALKITAPNSRRLAQLFKQWEHKLKLFGGDPSSLGEKEFRPLRLSREEDWSDWLKELLERSTSGVLAETMFATHVKCDANDFETPEVVERETPAEDQEGKRRGDILVKCQSELTINLEVKVGDKNFEKTFETARILRRQEKDRARRKSWHDFILIPEESAADWEIVASEHGNGNRPVRVVLWSDVARGLRRSLWEAKESFVWRAWAWTVCGRIEDEILNLRRTRLRRSEFAQLGMTLRWLKLLEHNEGEQR